MNLQISKQLKEQSRLQRRNIRENSESFIIPEERFREIFRLTIPAAINLIDLLRPHLQATEHRTAVSTELKVLASLRFYATGSYQRGIGKDFPFGMSQTAVHRAIHEVTRSIDNHLANNYIQFPHTRQERDEVKVGFLNKWGIGGVIGAVNGTHVAILCPAVEGHNYMNRKGFYSENVQLRCDANLKILNVNVHDSFIWRASAVQRFLRQYYEHGEINSWLLGDSSYPLQPFLLTPFANAQPNTPEERYNYTHSSARNCIERCIGVLKTRFRCLLKERSARYSPEFMGTVINACCTLHNICLNNNIQLNEQYIEEQIQNDDGNVVQADENDIINAGRVARNGVVNRYFR